MPRQRTIITSALLAAALVPALAHAQRHDDRDHRYGHPGSHVENVPPRWADQPRREWHRGDRLPPEFRDRQYVIDDWRGYHLSPPPRGYQWVGVGGDHLLVQIGSGIVLRIGD
ncbi:RcnB family protein [Burkholderia metallica]|uniref:RcnB family protein n=1 Tax=Burkholderia metallica TaxID=488729 RepID=UPI000D19AACA|nr:RcnB family protein [Burkholderia metallica]